MFIQCPQCRSLTSTDHDQTSDGLDMVRCDYCGFYFSGTSVPQVSESQTIGSVSPPESAATETSEQETIPHENENSVEPSFNIKEPVAAGSHTERNVNAAAWSVLSLVFILLLAAQYAYFNREMLAKHDVLRPFLEQLCKLASCKIPQRRDLSKIIIVERDVRSHPRISDALQVSVIINNIATFTQPFPRLQLSFYDINGSIEARRRFDPHEYLAKTINIEQGMPSQIPVFANLEIIDPGTSAVNFRFEFF